MARKDYANYALVLIGVVLIIAAVFMLRFVNVNSIVQFISFIFKQELGASMIKKVYLLFDVFLYLLFLLGVIFILISFAGKGTAELIRKILSYCVKSLNKLPLWFVVLIFVVIALFIHGYQFPGTDNSVYIPIIKKSMNPNLYKNDLLFMQTQKELSYSPDLIGKILKYVDDIETVFFVLYILSSYLIFYSIARITQSIFKKKEIMYIVLLLSIIPQTVGGTAMWTHEMHMHPRIIAVALALLSILFFIDGKSVISAVLLGIGFLIHPISVIGAFCSIMFYLLIKKRIVILILALLVFLIIASPLIYRGLNTESDFPTIMTPNQRELVRSTYIYPLSWKYFYYASFLLFLIVFLSSFYIKEKSFNEKDMKVMVIAAVSLFLFCFAIIFASIIPVTKIIQLQLSRGLFYLYWFAIIYLGFVVYNLLTQRDLQNKVLSIIGVFGFIIGTLASSSIIAAEGNAFNVDIPYYSEYSEEVQEWINVQEWAKHNTQIDSVFIVPPNINPSFRVFSERPTVLTFLDDGPMVFGLKYTEEFYRREKDLMDYDDLDGEELKELAIKYNALYIVVKKGSTNIELPLLFENKYFRVYKNG